MKLTAVQHICALCGWHSYSGERKVLYGHLYYCVQASKVTVLNVFMGFEGVKIPIVWCVFCHRKIPRVRKSPVLNLRHHLVSCHSSEVWRKKVVDVQVSFLG